MRSASVIVRVPCSAIGCANTCDVPGTVFLEYDDDDGDICGVGVAPETSALLDAGWTTGVGPYCAAHHSPDRELGKP